ncbi:NAD-dependent epimerase/dehydratase family protein [Tengunoibacter tsumagoiensis]|uniref:Oxidoreductase n=1 Tax=Tengunoibacter tsumagoiensis TaxID=2014871 RepID=A0A402A365_9CHLR|nr:NAD-dependent epimerase/dehydratase family protein [Tengunoibacter tsumagoiensis]GCE13584.1 oxidoreductase [Tengunoibacter tsumagoiensis]
MKALVTGAAGFLGGHLVEMLVERGDEVRAFIQPGQDRTLLQSLPGVEVIEGDLTDAASLKKAVQGIQRVYHIAAKTGPWGPEEIYQATNVQGVLDLIAAAQEAGVERIVHTSSITVYGHHLRGLVAEDYPYHAENNPYSRTKISSENLIFKLVKEKGAPVVVIRPGWIYGPRDTASFARFVSLVQSGKGFLLGSGKNIVPIVYVRDVAQGLIKAGDAGNEAVGRAYTIANDQRVTQAEYLNSIADALQVPHISRSYPFTAIFLAGQVAEAVWRLKDSRQQGAPPPVTTYGVTLLGRDQRFSIDRARQELGYAPEFDLKRGVALGVEWYLKERR